MRIGIDFDNTIISYDAVFHEATREWGFDVSGVAPNKTAVRDFLRGLGKEETWIELQGYVYGRKMIDAEPFPGVLEFFAAAKQRGVELRVISHKTRHPFRGPQYDLHEASRHWLDKLGLTGSTVHGIGGANVFLELTKEDKAARIAAEKCDVFIDDLPEFLTLPSFPPTTEGLLFAPAGNADGNWSGRTFASWHALQSALLTEVDRGSDSQRSGERTRPACCARRPAEHTPNRSGETPEPTRGTRVLPGPKHISP